MKLLDCDQTIALQRGEAYLLFLAANAVWQAASLATLAEPPQPLDLGLLLAVPVLQRLGKRLWRVHAAETEARPGRKPRRFRLSAEEIGVLMRYVWPQGTVFTAGVLGKVQQKSLSVMHYVRFD